jgi:hypothetical protein
MRRLVDSIINNWVKNVNNLRVTYRTTSAHLSPTLLNTQTVHNVINGKPRLIQTSIPTFTQWLSTRIYPLLYLLMPTYTHYPQHLLIEPIKKI